MPNHQDNGMMTALARLHGFTPARTIITEEPLVIRQVVIGSVVIPSARISPRATSFVRASFRKRDSSAAE
jgi:hypothetical protein